MDFLKGLLLLNVIMQSKNLIYNVIANCCRFLRYHFISPVFLVSNEVFNPFSQGDSFSPSFFIGTKKWEKRERDKGKMPKQELPQRSIKL